MEKKLSKEARMSNVKVTLGATTGSEIKSGPQNYHITIKLLREKIKIIFVRADIDVIFRTYQFFLKNNLTIYEVDLKV